ncbi:MAG: MinD/ParA family protein, partial [Treponema sp.]|nr:MinD/ParA family protein [Treponema sp.]
LGVMYRDSMQDRALASRLPVTVYKPGAVLSQAVFRIAEKIIQSETLQFDADSNNFEVAAEEANDDFSAKMSYVEDLLGAGALTQNELVELIKTLQFENNELRKENTLLKSKIVKAAESGYKF